MSTPIIDQWIVFGVDGRDRRAGQPVQWLGDDAIDCCGHSSPTLVRGSVGQRSGSAGSADTRNHATAVSRSGVSPRS
jgi:hypothetical protein